MIRDKDFPAFIEKLSNQFYMFATPSMAKGCCADISMRVFEKAIDQGYSAMIGKCTVFSKTDSKPIIHFLPIVEGRTIDFSYRQFDAHSPFPLIDPTRYKDLAVLSSEEMDKLHSVTL